MAETSVKTNTSKTVEIDYQGWNEATAKLVDKNKKIENVKSKILATIQSNIEFYSNKGKTLSPTVRILKDVEDYTTIVLRCGTFPLWKNTVKKGMYEPTVLLNDLQNKVESGFFAKEIENYIDKPSKKTSAKKANARSGKNKKVSNEVSK